AVGLEDADLRLGRLAGGADVGDASVGRVDVEGRRVGGLGERGAADEGVVDLAVDIDARQAESADVGALKDDLSAGLKPDELPGAEGHGGAAVGVESRVELPGVGKQPAVLERLDGRSG